MVKDLIDLNHKISNTLQDLPDKFMEGFVGFENELLDENEAQLKRGERADNSKIRPTYTVDYAEWKSRIGSTSSPTPDLYVTGGFYRSLFVVQTNKKGHVFIGSDYVVNGFPLGQHLQSRYGESILGFQKPVLEKYAKKTIELTRKKYLNELG